MRRNMPRKAQYVKSIDKRVYTPYTHNPKEAP